MDERTRPYGTMLQARTDAFGAPPAEQKRYLWGLAGELVECEQLRIVSGTKFPGSTGPTREILTRDPAVAHVLGDNAATQSRLSSEARLVPSVTIVDLGL
ncbi:hypothetical protein [Nesterenkonia ebinurensis]|uniref:hypothetical protein n=1 Tax=Nesterenkonia ebinurensis TaxID=2608252 RepID=UPI00123C7B72|nr:hypothetical protein [Nesterenkonia ebinurensis]